MTVLRVFWGAIKDVWEELFILALMNLVTVLLLVPVVTFPPALAGLWSAANLAARGKSIAWSDYFGAFKHFFGKSWALAGINIGIIVTLGFNIWFYRPDISPFNLGDTASLMIRAFWTSILVIWIILQLYPLAMLMEQEDQRIRLALRNALVLLAAHPGFSLLLGIIVLVLLAVSVLIPALLALISLAIVAVTCNKAVQHLLVPYRERLAEQEAEEGDGDGAGDDGDEADAGDGRGRRDTDQAE